MDLANQIKKAREKAGLSQSQAAKKWGIKLRALQTWEQGISIPGGKNMLKLMEIIKPR